VLGIGLNPFSAITLMWMRSFLAMHLGIINKFVDIPLTPQKPFGKDYAMYFFRRNHESLNTRNSLMG
jgi:hypothetical protein